MRLINKDALKAKAEQIIGIDGSSEAWRILSEIDNAEEIDAEPVVRCKDCKWCEVHYDTDGNAPYWICRNWDGGTDADGFCYEAERETDG